MMAITTSSSISVNPRRSLVFMKISLSNERTTREFRTTSAMKRSPGSRYDQQDPDVAVHPLCIHSLMMSHGIEGQQRANGSRRSQSAIYHIRFGTSSRKLTDAASQMVEKELCRCTTESFAPHGNTAARRQTIVSIRQRPKGLPAVTWSCETAPTWSSLEYPLDRKPFSWHPKFPERKRRAGASPEPRLTHHHSHCNRSSRPAARASPPQPVFDSHGERARSAFF